MEIFIGIRDNTRQLALDVDMSENELIAKVNEALASAHAVLDLTDPSCPPTPSHTCRSPPRPSVASASRSTESRRTNEAGEPERSRYRPRIPGLVSILWPQAFR